ncbi:hypothetical protein PsorP6_000565 [Peronosclerospora sorghi]|uniref:Uncharacterized protein n=1 Tax=Peronosclerospora sorghi TaxID=230839 RepID=A0ACC0WW52_9STRA|nr:hypothetical protein PsorP6_000565 [Peronosclerospora sorghi]
MTVVKAMPPLLGYHNRVVPPNVDPSSGINAYVFPDGNYNITRVNSPSSLWTKRLEHFRDFKTIRNAGISFNCTDRDVCMKLGGRNCEYLWRKFKIQPFSKYSHWYYVDLQRLLDDATDGIIYDWFVDHGTHPVYITPAPVIGGLRSRSRRVYFNPKTPPKCVMVDPRTPLRQILFTVQGFTVIHHRINAYNQHVPPFINVPPFIKETKEGRALLKKSRIRRLPLKSKAPPAEDKRSDVSDNANETAVMDASDSDDDNGSVPPSFEERSDSSDNADMNTSDDDNASPSCNDDSVISDNFSMASTQSGDQLESDSGEANTIEEIRDEDEEPTFPVDPIRSDDFAPVRIRRAKCMVFGTIADPQVDLQPLPPSQKESYVGFGQLL